VIISLGQVNLIVTCTKDRVLFPVKDNIVRHLPFSCDNQSTLVNVYHKCQHVT
jgi:hypothetical protein